MRRAVSASDDLRRSAARAGRLTPHSLKAGVAGSNPAGGTSYDRAAHHTRDYLTALRAELSTTFATVSQRVLPVKALGIRPSTANTRKPGRYPYARSGCVMSGDLTCSSRLGPVRGTVLHVATAVPASASTTSRTRCGVVMT
jgi:hypothetical protein